MRLILSFSLLLLSTSIFAQFEQAEGVHQIEQEKLTIPTSEMKKETVGRKLSPFMANDTDGKEHFSGNYLGKPMIIYFWKKDCSNCKVLAERLRFLNLEHNDIAVISFFDEKKAVFAEYTAGESLGFPTIANAKFLSEGIYLGELGYPRVFAIGADGNINGILDQNDFGSDLDENFQKISQLAANSYQINRK